MDEVHSKKIDSILLSQFSNNSFGLDVDASLQSIPLLAANVKEQTRSFSLGQIVYIYDVYWGMNENAKVVARFRRKYSLVRSVVPIKTLENFRPKIVYEPRVIKKLHGEKIDRRIFFRFFEFPPEHQSLAADTPRL